MKTLKLIGIVLAAVVALVVVVVAFKSPHNHMERSIVINADAATIFPYLTNLRKSNEWSPWMKMDTTAQQTFEGPEEGIGAKMSWVGDEDKVGSGEQWITEVEDNKRVKSGIKFGDFEGDYFGELTLEPAEGGTKVTWHYYGDVSKSSLSGAFFGKLFSMFTDSMLGPPYEQGLNDLKKLIENLPPAPPVETTPADTTAVQP